MAKLSYPFTYCKNPERIVNPYTKETLIVPCLKCEACQQAKASRYVFQLQCEMESSLSNYFVTLTYANRFVPRMFAAMHCFQGHLDERQKRFVLFDKYGDNEELGSFNYDGERYNELIRKCNLFGDLPYLKKKNGQDFIKRLRERLRPLGYSVRFFLSGEYSPEHFRPHFHLILSHNYSELDNVGRYKLGEFPEWTWSKSDKFVFTKDTPISVLEYHIRKSWTFGMCDVQKIDGSNPARYVSGYVNGSCNLPDCFKLPSTRPFCTHSVRLGRKLFDRELREIFESSADDLVRRSLYIDGVYNEFDLPVHYYASVYPKCQGFAERTDASRYEFFKTYDSLRETFGDLSCWRMSGVLTEQVMNLYYYKEFKHSVAVPNSLIHKLMPYDTLCKTLEHYQGFQTPVADIRAVIRRHVYSYLLPSAVVSFNVDTLWQYYSRFRSMYTSREALFKIYIKKLIDFVSKAELLKLSKFYDAMSKYALSDLDTSEDFVYFYNNGDYSMEDFKELSLYKRFCSNVDNIAREAVKHKRANDLNLIFSDNG